MLKFIQTKSLTVSAAVIAGMLIGSEQAHATAGNADWSTIANNIADSIEELPGLISALAYMIGLLMGVLGIMKIKDHVENPSQTPMKDGAVRLAAGGALFGLPIVFESMQNTIGTTTQYVETPTLSRVEFNLR